MASVSLHGLPLSCNRGGMLLVSRSSLSKQLHTSWLIFLSRNYSVRKIYKQGEQVTVAGKEYPADNMTNVTPHLLSHVGKNIHLQKFHPLNHIYQRIVQYMYKRYVSSRGNPLFSVHNQLHPVVTTYQNFDSLLIPKDHVSRRKSDNYYINNGQLLRAHTSAHQVVTPHVKITFDEAVSSSEDGKEYIVIEYLLTPEEPTFLCSPVEHNLGACELINMGFDNFVVIGDVYRRDEIDASHYPVFHQVEGVRLCTKKDVFGSHQNMNNFKLFESTQRAKGRQGVHSAEAVQLLERDLKGCLLGLATTLFGQDVEARWVDAYFPFTHPSWELEVKFSDDWVELLGCGVIEQEILVNCGVQDKIGWAFGLGLERWAMKLYGIPDIRLFWSKDPGFLSQFKFDDPTTDVKYKPVSKYTQCSNDISFWLPGDRHYDSADFFDIVRYIGGNTVEQVHLIDTFTHPKTKLTSHCYRIVYRHMERVLTQQEVNILHKRIEEEAAAKLDVTLR